MARRSRPDGKDLQVALQHPLRRRILEAMEAEEAVTPSQLATVLGHPRGRIRYHFGVLADCAAFAKLEPRARPAGESQGERAT